MPAGMLQTLLRVHTSTAIESEKEPVEMRRYLYVLTIVALLTVPPAAAQIEPHAGMLRFPDVSATHIVFLYANDLWLVPREGGMATPLASPPGEEGYPRFSPSGETIAFMGNYDGGVDLYTVPTAGGVPTRVTYHPGTEVLNGWASEDELIFHTRGRLYYPRAYELFTVPAAGGLPEKMPVPYGAVGALSADGEWLAYTPHTRDHRTWKRYRGGMATDIWLYNLAENTSVRLSAWEGTDTLPMWQDERIYYLSDEGPSHRLNIWVYDTTNGLRHQVTSYTDYDVKWPSNGPGPSGGGEIVYQYGPELHLLDLETEQSRAVQVTIPGDRPRLRPQTFDAAEQIFDRQISATGKRALLGARGDIWTLPAEHGSPVNLTRTGGIAERDPAWSPDGRWVAYFSDASGEGYELWVTQSDGLGESRRLTEAGKGFLFDPVWSPDSERIAFWDQTSTLWLFELDDGSLTEVAKDAGLGTPRVSWSHDSNWLAFASPERLRQPASIWLYEVDAGSLRRVTAGWFNDSWPTFDRQGEYLYFASQREFSEPIYEDVGTTWIYAHVDRLYAVPLRDDVGSPLLPEVDREDWSEDGDDGDDGDDEEEGDDEDEEEAEEAPEPLEIDLEGFERRAIQLPVERGNFTQLTVNDEGQLLYVRRPTSELLGEPVIQLLDLDDDEEPEKTVLDGADYLVASADGEKILAAGSGKMAIVEARPDQELEPLSTDGMSATVDPRAEWRQLFDEAWRLQRDFFYDPNMHGVDWPAVRSRYEPMLADCASRDDVTFVIQEMISELNVGHAYYRPGSLEEAPETTVGLLGVDWELHDGAYRIAEVLEGAPWDVDARGPLSQPGVDVAAGDYVLAVNGVPIDTTRDPWAAFQGMAGATVTLTVGSEPTIDDDARHVPVELLESDRELRYRRWVEANRAYVAEESDGQVGYIYVPNTGIQGQNELVRQFFGQVEAPALIIDERWNGGGQIPTRFVELLDRPVANYWSLREGEDVVWPPDAHHGPKCMLINGLAGSGGDYLPFWFRESGLGKLVGTRTWGGLVGIGGGPRLIDGTRMTAPNFAFYEKDGTWGIEGHGVEPDIEVIDHPAWMTGGRDPQLDAAIDLMLEELQANPYIPPQPPAYPDRSGMGLPPEDQ